MTLNGDPWLGKKQSKSYMIQYMHIIRWIRLSQAGLAFKKIPSAVLVEAENEWMRTSAIKGIFTKLLFVWGKRSVGWRIRRQVWRKHFPVGSYCSNQNSLLSVHRFFHGFSSVFFQITFTSILINNTTISSHKPAERIPFITRLSSFQLSRTPQHRGVKSHVTKAGDPFSSWLRK